MIPCGMRDFGIQHDTRPSQSLLYQEGQTPLTLMPLLRLAHSFTLESFRGIPYRYLRVLPTNSVPPWTPLLRRPHNPLFIKILLECRQSTLIYIHKYKSSCQLMFYEGLLRGASVSGHNQIQWCGNGSTHFYLPISATVGPLEKHCGEYITVLEGCLSALHEPTHCLYHWGASTLTSPHLKIDTQYNTTQLSNITQTHTLYTMQKWREPQHNSPTAKIIYRKPMQYNLRWTKDTVLNPLMRQV